MIGMTRRSLNQALLATAAALAVPASASAQQLKSLKITAPAGPGGGYDQLARTLQEVLMAEKLVASVQVINVPGAGGTVGLAGFANSKERDPALLVAGLGLVGATFINKAPVPLEQVAPLARLQGEYQPLFVAANSPIKTVKDLLAKFTEKPLRFFGLVGSVFLALGAVISLVLLIQRVEGQGIANRPALLLGVLLVALGVQLIGLGLVGEIIVHLRAPHRRAYRVRERT